ncbi:MAG: hypothetical protein IKC34_00855 [Clostridia bacterium]|nr:hypothetical protein [Clostridia bacterium]
MEEILESGDLAEDTHPLPESEAAPAADGEYEPSACEECRASTESELLSLAESFPEILAAENPDEVINLERYAELRALGLTEREAYMATRRAVRREDNRAHLSPTVTKETRGPHSAMPEGELRACRELFFGMSDAEIRRLYKKVSV